jgi:hypothetical protein
MRQETPQGYRPMAEYIKPTLETKFHVDFDWWRQQNRKLRVHLSSHLCAECREKYADAPAQDIDWVDPYTGEVKKVDILWDVMRGCCSQNADYITPQTPLVFAVFLTFVANDNAPLSSVELEEALGHKSASTILRTLGTGQIYYGIRPVRMPVVRRRTAA